MVEKKHIVNELKLNYNGPLLIENFYREVENWMSEKGMQKDLKRKSEEVGSKGKKIEWEIEAWKAISHVVKEIVRIRVLFNNVREARIKRKGHDVRINQVEALIFIDGFLETKLSKQWHQNPLFFFLRTLYDKYIWKIWSERYDDSVIEDCYDLHKRLKAFSSLSKMKVR
jgi:hypothetical protein